MAGYARRALPPGASSPPQPPSGPRREIAGAARARPQRASLCRFDDGRLVLARELEVFLDPAEARDFDSGEVGEREVSWRSYVVRMLAAPGIDSPHAVIATYPYLTHDTFAYGELKRGWQRSEEERDRWLRERFAASEDASDFAPAAAAREALSDHERELFSSSSRERVAVLDRPLRPGRARLGRRLARRPRFAAHDVIGICPPIRECFEALNQEAKYLVELTREGEIFQRHASLAPLRIRAEELREPASGLEEHVAPVLEASILWALAGPYEGLHHERTNPRSLYTQGTPVVKLVEEIYVRVLFGIQQRLARGLAARRREEAPSAGPDEPDHAFLVKQALDALEANAELDEPDRRPEEEFLDLARSRRDEADARTSIALLEALACFSADARILDQAVDELRNLSISPSAAVQELAKRALTETRRCGRLPL